MLKASDFFDALKKENMDFFCGVPDSLLKDLCAHIYANCPKENNIIAANEGNALAIAAGHYLATGKPAVVYMQNSGEGNIINPLLSLVDSEVYNIPALLIIGWRGEPDVHDEPQHIKQGKMTIPLLETMGVQFEILEDISQVSKAAEYMAQTLKPFAFVVRKGTFEKSVQDKVLNPYSLSRESAIQEIVKLVMDTDIIVSTTGMISRELYENRKTHEKDFLTVGSMGHASSIALGIALAKKDRKVFCFDGDGALLMHMGALSVIAFQKLKNFRHIVFNNEAHDSVGGQPTVASNICITDIAKSCGYTRVYSVQNLDELRSVWLEFYNSDGTNLLEVKVQKGNRADLGRPKESPVDNKKIFMNFLKG